jgi:hypothetical protein
MATTKQTEKKVFVNLGIVPVRNSQGVIVLTQKYIVMREKFAKYMQAQFSSETPKSAPVRITKGKLAGRLKQVEYKATISGVKYEFGYYSNAPIVKNPKIPVKVTWVPVHVPKGLSTKEFLKSFLLKITKKPQFIRMPSGKSTRLADV